MEILGRKVDAVTYSNSEIYTAYVRLKEGDCEREKAPHYQCIDNCDGSFIVARYFRDQAFSLKCLAPVELRVHPQVPALKDVNDLEGLQRVAEIHGYSLEPVRKGAILYFQGQPVATYNPCGLTNQEDLFSDEQHSTIVRLQERLSEVREIAERKPLESIIDDPAMAAILMNPNVGRVISILFGDEGDKIMAQLRAMQTRRN